MMEQQHRYRIIRIKSQLSEVVQAIGDTPRPASDFLAKLLLECLEKSKRTIEDLDEILLMDDSGYSPEDVFLTRRHERIRLLRPLHFKYSNGIEEDLPIGEYHARLFCVPHFDYVILPVGHNVPLSGAHYEILPKENT